MDEWRARVRDRPGDFHGDPCQPKCLAILVCGGMAAKRCSNLPRLPGGGYPTARLYLRWRRRPLFQDAGLALGRRPGVGVHFHDRIRRRERGDRRTLSRRGLSVRHAPRPGDTAGDGPDRGCPLISLAADDDEAEYLVPVRWIHTVPREDAFSGVGLFGNQNTVCEPTTPKRSHTLDRLKRVWRIEHCLFGRSSRHLKARPQRGRTAQVVAAPSPQWGAACPGAARL